MRRPAARKPDLIGDFDSRVANRLLGTASDIVLVLDRDAVVLDLRVPDPQLALLLGEGWRGRLWRDLVTVEGRDKIDSLIKDVRAGQPARWRQVNHAVHGRDDIPVSYTALALVDEATDLQAPALLALGRDLRATAQLQRRLVDAQQAMERDYWRFREAETRYRTLFQTASEAVLIADSLTLKVLEANPAAEALFGRAAGRLAGIALPGLFEGSSQGRLQAWLAGSRSGLADAAPERTRVRLSSGSASPPDAEFELSLAVFRQQQSSQLLLRVRPAAAASADGRRSARAAGHAPAEDHTHLLEAWERHTADALAFTDGQGRVLRANAAFATLAQLASPEAARGALLDRWLGRTGVELNVLLTNLRNADVVAAFPTALRGEVGVEHEVEVSATRLDVGASPALAFSIRDIGRRIDNADRGVAALGRSPGELTELVGRVPMKDIVAETAEVIEQLCIETALQMTHNNRALAAQFLGLSRQSLYVKLRRYGLATGEGAGEGDG
ncbi:MAG: transcriptional regulator PpsR [Ideonella sp. WA131b]|jgi:transcriptional regulator PpsR|nr:transcriptional regulator PpsR [Ideonella sp. WA131b]